MRKYQFSALFPYKPDGGERDYLWAQVRKRYEQLFPQIELCIGTDASEPFCRSHAVNEAARKATGEVLIIVDTDVLFNGELIERVAALIAKRPWIIPFNKGIRLTQQATAHLLKEGIPKEITAAENDIEFVETARGPFMNVMTRSCFEAIGGLDERFKGWGREDSAMVYALDTLCVKHKRLEGSVYHLWHSQTINRKYLAQNNRLYDQYRAAKGNVKAMRKLINQR